MIFLPLLALALFASPALAQTCTADMEVIQQKNALRAQALGGDRTALRSYGGIVGAEARRLATCRSQTWPAVEALWLRLYACDLKAGALDTLMDDIVNKGYNRVHIEVFYDGRVLLPKNQNPTVWPVVVDQDQDLLALAIQKARERGLGVYAWVFSMQFGYPYARLEDRQNVIARNGRGQTSYSVISNEALLTLDPTNLELDKVFIDPYSPQAQQDFQALIQAVAQRKPDGVLFDYIRYPRLSGAASVTSKVQDLWIYGEASQRTILQRALNYKGQELIRRYLTQGYINLNDVMAVDMLYPDEGEPLWQTRTPSTLPGQPLPAAPLRLAQLQQDLWFLSVAHALQGVVDYLTLASQSAQQQGITSGAVFFPEANRAVGKGFDSRLQPWQRFPKTMEWHPMAYGVCGEPWCIVDQVQTVIQQAPPGVTITPALAGTWGRASQNRPSLEAQMTALQQKFPQLPAVSHFAYSWQEPQSDRERRSCQLR